MSSRSYEEEAPRVSRGSTASGPAPAARGLWESSGTRVTSATAAVTASAAGVVWEWERLTGRAQFVTPTGTVKSLTTFLMGLEVFDSVVVRSLNDCRRNYNDCSCYAAIYDF